MTKRRRHRAGAPKRPRGVVSLRRALTDKQLLGSAMGDQSWFGWRAVLLAAWGEPLTDEERAFYTWVSERDTVPNHRVAVLVLVIGRKGGKSRAMAVLAVFIAALCEHPSLVAGETGVVLCIAQSQAIAKIILDFAEGALRSSPLLRSMIERRTADALILTNGVEIQVRPSSYRNLRGPSYVACLADEIGFWWTDSDSANPDKEVIGAVRPALGLTNGPLIIASSPYAKRGVLFDYFKKYYGVDDPSTLVVRAYTRDMHPGFSQATIDAALAEDHDFYAAEYLAQFRSDLADYLDRETVESCVDRGVYERPPQPGVSYVGFIDHSGGMNDAAAICIAHRTPDGHIWIDFLHEFRSPFSAEAVTEQFAEQLHRYNLRDAVGDKFANIWPVEMFAKFNIRYEQSAAPKSDLYLSLSPLISSRRVSLLDHPRAINQLASLERRTARGGRDSVDHGPGMHDDLANVIAGAAVSAAKPKPRLRMAIAAFTGADGRMHDGYEIDPQTGLPLDSQGRTRIRVVRIAEKDAPAAKGP